MEIWRDVVGYEGFYQVSNFGNIKSCERELEYTLKGKTGKKIIGGQIMYKHLNMNGYHQIGLTKNNKRRTYTVHILVGKAFYNNTYKDGLVIDHKNNIKTDNRVENLQVITHRDNITKSKVNNLKMTGVYPSKNGKRYRSKIMVNNKTLHLGVYNTPEEAYEAYKKYKSTL